MKNDFFNAEPLSETISRMVDASERPLKAIAAEIGKGYSTLYRELDANDEGAKIGVDTLLPLIRACSETWPPKNIPAPVLWLNSKCGFKALPLTAEPDHPDVREEILDDEASYATFREAVRNRRNTPGQVAELARAVQREIDETVEQYRREWTGERQIVTSDFLN